jgi:predicted nucleic acid-binding protein
MTLIIDASAFVSLLIEEDQSNAVRAAVPRGTALLAPDLILAEIANTLWLASRRGRIDPEDAQLALGLARTRFARLFSAGPLGRRALQLALEREHPAYDCLYVALAEQLRRPLVTSDRTLAKRFGDLAEIRFAGPAPAAQGG